MHEAIKINLRFYRHATYFWEIGTTILVQMFHSIKLSTPQLSVSSTVTTSATPCFPYDNGWNDSKGGRIEPVCQTAQSGNFLSNFTFLERVTFSLLSC